MKTVISSGLFLLLICSLLGCGKKHSCVPVSGVVTVDGKPEGGIKLYFAPMATEDSVDSGPYSTGVTDENGGFVLESRHGDAGAVVGKHRVTLKYADPGAAGKALMTPEAEEMRKQIMEIRKGRHIKVNREDEARTPVIVEVSVPSDGTETLKIELTSRKIR